MNRVALYSRVSTSEQDTNNQELRLVDYAKNNGLEYDVFREVLSSRKTRPVKQDLLMRLRRGEYSAIVIYKLDRYARSFPELILEVKELLDKGVSFISLSDNLDFTTASGKLHFQILSAFADFERELIKERTKEGLRRTKMAGTRLGRPKGSKDSKKRSKSGYILRHAKKRQQSDVSKSIYQDIKSYL